VRRLCLLVLLCASARAHAAPTDLVARPITLDVHQVAADVWLDFNVAPGFTGESTSLAPDLWFGALPDLTVGLVHSFPSVDRFGPGASFCLSHADATGDCDSAYSGSGIDARYRVLPPASLSGGSIELAPRVRVLVRDTDPFKPALTLGALARWTRSRFALSADPYLELGLANIDQGNRHALFLPVRFAVQPLARWELALRTGINSDLHRYTGIDGKRHIATDEWHVPIAIETRVRIDDHFDAGAMLGFSTLLGPQNTAKERVLFFVVSWRS